MFFIINTVQKQILKAFHNRKMKKEKANIRPLHVLGHHKEIFIEFIEGQWRIQRGSEGVKSPFSTDYFIFMGNFEKSWVN